MITRNSAGGTLSAGFITKLQARVESPRIVFRFATDSTTNTNEAVDTVETIIDVVDNSVFSDNDIISIDDEWMLITNATVGANQIQVTRDYGITVAATHNTATDIYILNEYPVLNISDISVDNELGSSEAVVTVSNADQSWNIFLSDLTNHGNQAQIELKFDGLSENMTVWSGVVDHTEYEDDSMTLSIYLSQPIAKLLDTTIDPRPEALIMVNGPDDNPLDFIWAILVDEGGLDSTASQANKDIDYASWSATQVKVGAQNIDIRARLSRSHTYRSAIQAVLYICSCWSFITHEGKIGFAYAANDAVAGDDTWTAAHILRTVDGSRIAGHRISTDVEEIVNDQFVSHEYIYTRGKWQSDIDGTIVNNQDATSQNDYGVHSLAEADTNIWHFDVASATGGSDWVEDINKDPKIFSSITTWLYGARIQPGDVVDLTDPDYGFTNKLMKIERILSFNMTNFTLTVLARA